VIDASGDFVVDPPAQTRGGDQDGPTLTPTLGDHAIGTPAGDTNPTALTMRAPRCSRKKMAASTVVATSSKFNIRDAVAAVVCDSPATSNAGPSAPPTMTATASGLQPRRNAFADGGRRIHKGTMARPTPTYSGPANIKGVGATDEA
jgi:hypothetical protein